MNGNQNRNQPKNGLTPKPPGESQNSVLLLDFTQPHLSSSSGQVQPESNVPFIYISDKKSETPVKQTVFNSANTPLNNSGSSDTLKDAVRKWHAKRKKNPNDNDDSKKQKKLTKTSSIMLGDKSKQPEIKLADNKSSLENSVQTIYISNEQKYSKSSSELETDIKDPFDGPLSFDAIMALKKKKNEADFDEASEKNINSPAQESSSNKIRRSKQVNETASFESRIKNQVETTQKKVIAITNNFQSCSTQSEIIQVFADVINCLFINIEEVVQKQALDEEEKTSHIRNSLELCINIVSQKSNNVTEELDELALDFLAKYPIVFESLKTLTNIESLNDSTLDAVHKYILNYISPIDRINHVLRVDG
ncbi:hypothetical protein RS030_111768 [Cryptosporidium xiaoi]|uniref:Uncharacterized protein n=1 Tax=Cryptosporidium xiaoi TaxID=659607 RepID=A0AAV9YCD0_9CRYT